MNSHIFSTPAITERIDNIIISRKRYCSNRSGLVNDAIYNKMINSALHTDGVMKIASGDLHNAEVNFSRILGSDSAMPRHFCN